ncbi:MAG: putative sulfate/molybdate transporter, partial [Chloroflexota bacterium]
MPVQPLKVVAATAISLSLSPGTIGAAGLLMGIVLLFLSLTNLISLVVKVFPPAVVRGIQLSIGLTLLRKGVELAFGKEVFISGISPSLDWGQFPIGIFLALSAVLIFLLFRFTFLRQRQHFPPSLALLTFGAGSGFLFGTFPSLFTPSPVLPNITLPSPADLWLAVTVLVLPQLPLTLGNAVVGTSGAAKTYFKEQACEVTPRALTASMGLANLAAGLFGAMPMCHGSGGLTAHYKLGARTGGANLMVGGLLLAVGLLLGSTALPFLSLIPLPVLGVLLAIVGIYHALLVCDLKSREQLVVAGTVATATIVLGNLAYGFGSGILLHHLLKLLPRGSAFLALRLPRKKGRIPA